MTLAEAVLLRPQVVYSDALGQKTAEPQDGGIAER